jgi:hypothetical protein
LHEHIYRYLGDRFLMNNIQEFRSPDFHDWSPRAFAAILLLTLIAFANNRFKDQGKLRFSQFLVVLLATHAGFYSARNLPVSSMLLALIAGPMLWEDFASLANKPGAWQWVRNRSAGISNFSDRMGAQEMELRGHLWPVVSVALAFAISLQGGWLGRQQLIHAQFDPKKVPAGAVTFLQQEVRDFQNSKNKNDRHPSAEPVFSTDAWSGYLIYRMYPERKVVVDDRHDLYGSQRIRQYLILTQVEPGWQDVLENEEIRTVLLPTDSTLANMLRALPRDWRVAYEDKVAVVLEKR